MTGKFFLHLTMFSIHLKLSKIFLHFEIENPKLKKKIHSEQINSRIKLKKSKYHSEKQNPKIYSRKEILEI